jgi:carboxymethylenebutenolidase
MRPVLDLDTPDGPMEVRIFPPAGRPRGGVIFYMDAFGLRPELDDLCARHAAAGWLTLLPDLYHRLPRRHFRVPRQHDAPLDPAMDAANDATSLAMSGADTAVLIAHAAAAHGVTRLGAVGHCMGARQALAAAARFPDRVLAAACLHGGRMVRDGADSPHRLIAQCRGGVHIAMARDDPTCPEPHQRLLEQAAAAAGPHVVTERVAALHGWTFPERWCHDPAAAARAFAATQALFDRWVAGGPRPVPAP